MAKLSIRLFGPFEVLRDGRLLDERDWRSRQNRTILQLLLSRQGSAVPSDQLLDILWPDDEPEAARRRLHVRISQLRRTLNPGQPATYIKTVGGGYTFSATTGCWIDTEAFERQAERGRRAQEDDNTLEAITAYETARTLYRGDFLEENIYDDWTFAIRERMRERYLVVLTELAECYARQGRYRRAVSTCQQVLAVDGVREAVYVRLMLYYYYAGERTEALRAYDTCRRQLEDQLAVQPLAATHYLAERIRDGTLWSEPEGPRYPPPAYEGRLFAVPYSLSVPPFIGREREYAWLVERWQNLSCGLITVRGEAGSGKSRLVEEFLGYIAQQGSAVLRGHGQAEPSLPYSAIARMLEHHAHEWDLSSMSRERLASLAHLLPKLAGKALDSPSLPELPAAQEEERLLAAVTEFFKAGLHKRTVLFIDDAHLLDQPSVRLLVRLAQELIVVLAYRSDEPAREQTLESALRPLRRQGLLAELQLASLSPAAVRRLIRSFAGREMPALAEKIVGQTMGNPLFILASLQYLFEEGVLYVDPDNVWATAAELPPALPPSTKHAIAARLGRLSQVQRGLFDLAAVVAGDFDFQLLQAASDLDEDVLLDAVDALLAVGLLAEPRALDRRELALGHDLYGQVAYQTLPAVRRRRAHGRVAQALLAVSADHDADAPALAHHFQQAGDQLQASAWFVQAGDGALARYAHDEALSYYRRALALNNGENGPIWSRMGYVARHLARYEEAAGHYGHALAFWVDAADQEQQIRCHYALAECYRELSDCPQAASHARHGLEMASGHAERVELAARGHIILSNAMRTGQLAPAGDVRQRLQQALALAQPAQAWQLVGEATFWLGVVAINQGDAAQALAYDRQAIDYFKRTKQTGWQAIAYNNIAFHALRAGQPHLAHEQAGLGLELARQIGSLHTQGWLLSTLGEVEIYLDRLPEARTHLNEALALVSKWGPVRLEPGLLVDLAQVSMAGQDWEAAVSRLERAQALARATAPQFLPSLEVALGQAYLGQGRPVMALSIAQQALIAAESKTQQGVAGMALRLLGQIHAAGGRQGQAREAFAASIERLSEIGDGLECARTHAAMGSWLASQGDPAAEALLQSARLAFEEAGASLYLRQFRVSAARR